MAFKFVVFAALVAVSQAGLLDYSGHQSYEAPVAKAVYAAPVAKAVYAAPVAKAVYSAPVAKAVYSAPVAKYAAAPAYHHEEEEYGPAEYSFEYSVHDEHTGDIKSQKEERHGDQVTGSYMLVEPDGSRRIVEYTADKHSGFNAVVRREEAKHQAPVQPVLKKVVAPVAVAAAPAYHSYQQASPAYQSYQHSAPAYQSYQHSAPAHQSYQHSAPAHQSYQQAAPAYQHSAPSYQSYQHSAPAHQSYQQAAPAYYKH